jgi:TusA-related sulfurtransferase
MSNDPQSRIIQVDMRGQVCPSTLLVAMDNLNRHGEGLQSGALKLLIITDNREALHTVPATAENMGYAARITKTTSHYEILIGLPDQER